MMQAPTQLTWTRDPAKFRGEGMGEHLIDDRTRVLAATRREDVGFQAAGAEGLSVKDIDKGEVSPGLR